MYRNILVATDGSASARRALDHAIGLASALNAQLTILGVVAPIPTTAYASGMSLTTMQSDAIADTEGTLRDAVDHLDGDIPAHTRLRQGHPAHEIVAQAHDGQHDLVVLGSRGRGRLGSTILGSVAGGVHFHLHVPLLVIHTPESE